MWRVVIAGGIMTSLMGLFNIIAVCMPLSTQKITC
jgi:hypothetical protein